MARASKPQLSDSERTPEVSGQPVRSAAPMWISLSIILGSLTNSIMMGSVNVALPTMMTSLRAEVNQIQWVLTSFMIARTVVMPTLGWAGGRLGNRQLYLITLSIYVVASMLCGLAWDLGSMVFFRVLQGIGAGYLFPLGMTILHETYPPGKRGTAMGMFMFGMSFGPAIGPTLGGYLVEHLSWRAVFYINFPIGLVAFLSAAATLPQGGKRQSKQLDMLGLATMTSFVISLLLAVSQVRDHGWGSMYIMSLLGIAGISLLAFLLIEWKCEVPLISLQIFANLQFVLGAIVTFFESFTNFAMNFILALFLQQGLGLNAQYAGELLLPAAIVWGLTSLGSGRLSDVVEARWLVAGGSVLSSIVFFAFLRIDPWTSAWAIIVLLIFRSLARGFIQSPIMTVTMASLPDHQVRLGAGVRGLLNSLGATFGIAMAGFFLQQRIALRTSALQENQLMGGVEYLDLTGRLQQLFHDAGEIPALIATQTEATLNRWLVQEATLTAYHDMFFLTAVVVFLGALPVLWLRSRRSSE